MFMSNILASSSFSLGVTGTSRMLCHQLLPSWGIHECELYGVLACASQLPTEWSSRNTCWVVRSIRSIPIPISISHAPPIIRGHSLTTVVQHLRPAQRSVANFHVTWFKEKSAGIPHVTCSKKHGAGSPVLLEIRSLQACAKRSWPSTTNPGSWPPAARRAVPSTCVRWWPAWASCSEWSPMTDPWCCYIW